MAINKEYINELQDLVPSNKKSRRSLYIAPLNVGVSPFLRRGDRKARYWTATPVIRVRISSASFLYFATKN